MRPIAAEQAARFSVPRYAIEHPRREPFSDRMVDRCARLWRGPRLVGVLFQLFLIAFERIQVQLLVTAFERIQVQLLVTAFERIEVQLLVVTAH